MATKTAKKNKPKCTKGTACGYSCIAAGKVCNQPVPKEAAEADLAAVPAKGKKKAEAEPKGDSKEAYAARQKMIIERLRPKSINSGLLDTDEDIDYMNKPTAAKVAEKAATLEADGGKNVHPVIMRRKGDGYEVVYGEDWVEAARQNGGGKLFSHVFDMTDEQAKETRKEMEKLASGGGKTKIDTTAAKAKKPKEAEEKDDASTYAGRQKTIMARLTPKPDNAGLLDVDQITDVPKTTAKGVKEKAASLEKHGKNLQPVVLRRKGDDYEVVYGEDWVEAAKKTKQKQLWSQVYDLTDEQAKEMRQKMKNLE